MRIHIWDIWRSNIWGVYVVLVRSMPIACRSVYMVYLRSMRIHTWDMWRSIYYGDMWMSIYYVSRYLVGLRSIRIDMEYL